MSAFDIDSIRAHFPSLSRTTDDGVPVAWLDGPAGTQVPLGCIDAITSYLRQSNSNSHGLFGASRETDALLADVHAGMADMLGTRDHGEVSFGPNMTTITYAVSRAIGASLQAGDEIVLSRLDHDANVAPWLALARERDLVVRWIGIDESDVTLDLDDLDDALGPRTRLVAVGLASNAVGTINPVGEIARRAHAVGAQVWVDAVHAAPHVPIDVGSLGADFLVCSAYKFYGPHLGILWGRRELLEALPHYHVRPAGDDIPGRFETGTQAHELLAGLSGTLRYLEWVGATQGGGPGEPGSADGRRRERLTAAIAAARTYESDLVTHLIDGVSTIGGVSVRGITSRARADERCPTIAFTMEGRHPAAIARHLGDRGINTWNGDYYAYELIGALGLADAGGMVRVGIVHYNTAAEVDRLITALEELAGG